jgi:tRNA pseudouridine-54 N-methylase
MIDEMAMHAKVADNAPWPARTVTFNSRAARADGHEATIAAINQAAVNRVGKDVTRRIFLPGLAVATESLESIRIPNSNLGDTKNCR